METTLTISLKKSLLKKAKTYSKKTGRSLSELVERYLESIINEEKNVDILSPKLRKIVGAVKLPKNFNSDDELASYHLEKYMFICN